MRLAKYLAGQGVASRRKSEELIAEGRVSVNGNIIKEQGFKIDPLQDKVEVDGHMLQTADKVYLLLYKPAGYISSVSDPWTAGSNLSDQRRKKPQDISGRPAGSRYRRFAAHDQ